jgi:hypothetical protein
MDVVMKRMVNILARMVLLGAALVMTGCTVVTVKPAHDHGYGPPPHAPAHGYRHKYHDHELVFDAHLGVYIVVGLADYYFSDGHYYRHDRDFWHYSDRVGGKWHKADKKKVPPGLSKKHHNSDRSSKKGHGKERDND